MTFKSMTSQVDLKSSTSQHQRNVGWKRVKIFVTSLRRELTVSMNIMLELLRVKTAKRLGESGVLDNTMQAVNASYNAMLYGNQSLET